MLAVGATIKGSKHVGDDQIKGWLYLSECNFIGVAILMLGPTCCLSSEDVCLFVIVFFLYFWCENVDYVLAWN